MPKMNRVSKAAARGNADSRHPSTGSPVGRPRSSPSPPYATGIGDSRAKASDMTQTTKGSSLFKKASDRIPNAQH